MAKYVYPAVFKPESEGYSITFPDLENCFTQGEDMADGLEAASDAPCLTLYNNKAVKKTLTIPAWLNTMAERAGLNFSQVLQNGLKNELHVQ